MRVGGKSQFEDLVYPFLSLSPILLQDGAVKTDTLISILPFSGSTSCCTRTILSSTTTFQMAKSFYKIIQHS